MHLTTGSPANASPARRHDLLACAALIALATVAFGDVLLGFGNFYLRDLTRYYYPAKHILREIAFAGEFPYWNRLFSAGQPLAANPEHEVFYPFTWLILLPSYDFGFRLLVLSHVWISLVGCYALLRSMRLGLRAAAFGALSWGLGGVVMSYINLLPILFCAAWLPLTCLYLRRFLLERRGRDFALASLFFGLQYLVGEPTTVMQTGLLLGLYALYRSWYAPRRLAAVVRNVGSVAAVTIGGLLVGAVQILPAIDHVGDSARSRPFPFDLVSAWSMPWAKFAELLFPNILGHLSIDRVTWYWAGGLYPGMGSPFIFSIYAGTLVGALAIGGAFARLRGGRFVLLVGTISALLALGGNTPLLRWLYDAGIATAVRYPEKYAMMGVFALVLWAARSLEAILQGNENAREGALGFAAAIAGVAVVIAILAFTPVYEPALERIWGLTAGSNSAFIVKVTRNDWLAMSARTVAAFALLLTLRTHRQKVWRTCFFAFIAADLLPIAQEVNPRMPRHFFTAAPLAGTLPREGAAYRVFHEADWYGQEDPARKFFSTHRHVYWVVRNGLFPMTPAGSGIATVLERDYDKTALLPTIDLTDSVWDVKRSGRSDWWVPFMAMSNAWFRGEYVDFEKEKARVKGNFSASTPIRMTPAPRYPRYYFADQLVTIRDRSDFVGKLSKESFSERTAFVREKSFVPARGEVRGVHETWNTARLDVESHGKGYLVMSVTPHKYWQITLDGKPVDAVVTNIGYQGIVVPPGRHTVTMCYRNRLVPIGGAVSAAAALALAVLALRRPRPPAGLPERQPDAAPAPEVAAAAPPGPEEPGAVTRAEDGSP